VLPSRDEGLGLVAVEAHLCGTPVIGSASGGVPDVVAHERTGLLVPVGDSLALAAAMDDLLARSDRGASLGEAGRRDALARFTPAAVGRRYAELYARAIASRQAAGRG
jgi:glycosyltransferase involved in cell wall biosynthesis